MKISLIALVAVASVCALTDAGVVKESLLRRNVNVGWRQYMPKERYGPLAISEADIDRRINQILERKMFALFGKEATKRQAEKETNDEQTTETEESKEAARLKAEEAERLKAEEDARLKAEEDARLKAEEDARLKAEEDARLKAEEDARLKAEEAARLKAEEDARLKAEEAARLKAEEDARLKAEEDARLKAEEAERARLAKERIIFQRKYDFRYEDKLVELLKPCTSEGYFPLSGHCHSFYRCFSHYENDDNELLRQSYWRAIFECQAGHYFSAKVGACMPGVC